MKIVIDRIKLALFFLCACVIYIYATETTRSSGKKLDNKIAYQIWKKIEEIQNSFYLHDKTETLTIPILPDEQKKQLNALVNEHPDLEPLINDLLKEREEKNFEKFLEKKEAVLSKLRPIFRKAIIEEQQKRASQGWLDWIQNNISSLKNWILQKLS